MNRRKPARMKKASPAPRADETLDADMRPAQSCEQPHVYGALRTTTGNGRLFHGAEPEIPAQPSEFPERFPAEVPVEPEEPMPGAIPEIPTSPEELPPPAEPEII